VSTLHYVGASHFACVDFTQNIVVSLSVLQGD